MTITDLLNMFRTSYDLAGSGLPGFEDEEIRDLLEKAQYRVISQKIGGNNVYKQKFPDTSKRIDDLKLLIVRESDLSISNIDSKINYGFLSLPTEYLHLIELYIEYKTSGTTDYIKKAIQIDYNNITRVQKTERNTNPYIKDPLFVFDASDKLRIYKDSETTGTISGIMTYIEKPSQLNIASPVLDSFNNDVYYEIVDSAVNEAVRIATPAKAQISDQQLQKSE